MPPALSPPPVQLSALVLLLALGVATGVYWLIVLGHIFATARLPTPRSALRGPRAASLLEAESSPAPPRVCIVVPAHNEEAVIGTLAESLRTQDYPRLGVVFSLDRCTDGTADILRRAIGSDPRFSIHAVDSCPEGWAGKVHAIHSAVLGSPGARDADLLLFTDADTVFDPACVRACVALLEERRLDLLSLLSTLTSDRWFERVAQPAAGMELARQYPPRRVGRGRASRPFANGQFMLFRREAYDAVGGHAAAKDQLLEDIDLARRVAWSDRTVGVFMADGMLRCRMYPDWAAFRRGWKRIYTEAANCKPARLRQAALRLGLCGVIMPLGSTVGLFAGTIVAPGGGEARGLAIACAAAGACGLGSMLAALVGAMRLGSSPIISAALYPLGAAATMRILAEAADELRRGEPVRWGGREYVRPVR